MAQVTHDGWDLSTNTHTEDEIRQSVGAAVPSDAADPEPVPPPDPHSPAGPPADPPASAASEATDSLETPDDLKLPYSKRVAKLTAKYREQERLVEQERAERERLARELDSVRRAPSPPGAPPATQTPVPAVGAPADDPEPKIEDFSDAPDPYLALVKAQAKWEARQEFRQAEAKRQMEYAQREQMQAVDQHISRTKAYAAQHSDYDKVVGSSSLPVSRSMQEAIVRSEQGPAIAYYLAQHPEECAALAAQTEYLGPESVPLTRWTLESLLSRPAPAPAAVQATAATRTQAPPPIQPVGAGPTVTDEPPSDEDSLDAHVAYWNKKAPLYNLRHGR